jgi:hypothetical protein
VDPSVAGPLADCLRGLVVDRGGEAMPVREPLPLHLPREIADVAREGTENGAADGTPENADESPRAPASGSAIRRRPSPRPRRRG